VATTRNVLGKPAAKQQAFLRDVSLRDTGVSLARLEPTISINTQFQLSALHDRGNL
jgi:hypothetical protein